MSRWAKQHDVCEKAGVRDDSHLCVQLMQPAHEALNQRLTIDIHEGFRPSREERPAAKENDIEPPIPQRWMEHVEISVHIPWN